MLLFHCLILTSFNKFDTNILDVKTMVNADIIIGIQLTTAQLHFIATYFEVAWEVQKRRKLVLLLVVDILDIISSEKWQQGNSSKFI